MTHNYNPWPEQKDHQSNYPLIEKKSMHSIYFYQFPFKSFRQFKHPNKHVWLILHSHPGVMVYVGSCPTNSCNQFNACQQSVGIRHERYKHSWLLTLLSQVGTTNFYLIISLNPLVWVPPLHPKDMHLTDTHPTLAFWTILYTYQSR